MFNVVYSSGGVIDKIKELPYPHFSKFTKPYVLGRQMEILNTPTRFTDTYTLPFASEFLSLAFASNLYSVGDYWELTVGADKICETVYTKELPESVAMGNSFGIVYPVPANTPLRFDFYNVSGLAKHVWYNVKFLR